MTQEINQPGTFRGKIVEYGVQEADSGAAAVTLTVLIEEQWNQDSKEWDNWREYEAIAHGSVWVIKKDGSLNEKSIKNLSDCAGWDGSFTSLLMETWQPKGIQISVKADEYKGTVRHRISWINGYDSNPESGGNITEERAKELEAKYGPKLRALAGKVKLQTNSPPTKPVNRSTGEVPDDEIPF